jgi:hypothetical protein
VKPVKYRRALSTRQQVRVVLQQQATSRRRTLVMVLEAPLFDKLLCEGGLAAAIRAFDYEMHWAAMS